MAEVGVLNLTIRDNSKEAVDGLNKLVTALQRVKNAVGSGIDLGGFGDGLKKLCKIVDDELHGSTIVKLADLADSLKKLKDAGGSVSALGKISKITEGMSSASDAVSEMKANLNDIKATNEIKIPVKPAVDDQLKDIYLNEKGGLMGNTPDVPAITNKYRAFPDRTIEDYYEGLRWTKDENGVLSKYKPEKDMISEALHGNGTEKEQMNAIRTVAEATGKSVDEVKAKIAELSGVAAQAREKLLSLFNQHYFADNFGDVQQSIDNALGIGSPAKSAKESMQAFIEGMQGMDSVSQTVRELNPELAEINEKAEKASWSLNDLKESIGGLKRSAGQGIFGKLISQFERLVKYRMLRYIIRSITSGLKEGVENVYNYSKAINSALAPAMDSSVSMFAQMKNSLGAAVAPALQAIIPLLNQLVSGFINVINWANQLIALLNGQASWTRALPQSVSAFDKQKKAAGGAGAAIKDLLADWDELNIIQSESSGGGGGGTTAAEDYLKMFEEVGKFDNTIKKIVDFIKDNFDDILRIAKGIGLALLGWKLSNAFTGMIGKLGALVAAGAIIGVTWDITTLLDRKYMETGDTGFLIADALTNMVGATLAGTIIAQVLGGAAGLITAGIELTVSAGISYGISYNDPTGDRADALRKLAALKGSIGLLAMAAGFGIASGSGLLGLLTAAAVAAPLFTLTAAVAIVVEQWNNAVDIAKEAFSNTGAGGISVEEVFKALQDELDKATAGYSLVVDAFSGSAELKTNLADAFSTIEMLSATVKGGGSLTVEEAETFKKAWSTVFEAFEGLTSTSFDTIFAGLNKSLASENEEIRTQAKELRVSVMMMQENISEAMAQFKLEQEGLAAKVGKGTATEEETNKYFKNLEYMAKTSRNTLTELDTVLSGRKGINFGEPDKAVSQAVEFIGNVKEASDNAITEIETAYQTEMEAIDTAWRNVVLGYDAGWIDDDTFEMYEGLFESVRENFKKEADKEKEKVTSTVQDTYQAVMDQALRGLSEIPGAMNEEGKLDVMKVSAYLAEVMLPILNAADEAGAEFSEEFGKMFGKGINIQDWINEGWFDELNEYIKDLIENPENLDDFKTPALDNTELEGSITNAEMAITGMVNSIRSTVASLNGLGFSLNVDSKPGRITGKIATTVPTVPVTMMATGGFPSSGDLVMADENGNFEMMGRMGNQPVIANNNQIVDGISKGVSVANADVVSAINTLISVVQKQGSRPVEVKLGNPTSSFGQYATRSIEKFERASGCT